ncbi:MAG: bifunctional 2-polyprenyl-6-hydroxyphenol methylase/3-demethylubiquinol 3-O-methyltransferase UbiG [Alphaproteobacteria bacterium]|nr:bifunctional 2-polyprenyl-6-hydroxyphenol methylase/3-demethylubiquinol 3-O-methyltransferase UbiG [Alphaproteobacteria bacterium]
MTSHGSTVDPAEIEKFRRMAEEWWDPKGKFRPLHRFNPIRLQFLKDRICRHFGRDPRADRALGGLRLLDVGAGGGLVAEPMTRLGADVVGIDATARNVEVARLHAAEGGLAIDYRHAAAEDLAERGEIFDAVLALEIVEHVASLEAFVAATATLTRPGGLLVVATLNRTLKAFALAIVGAEYVLGWLPRGTHDWRKFVRPSELEAAMRSSGLALTETVGVAYNPVLDRWSLGSDLDVNYLAVATKA